MCIVEPSPLFEDSKLSRARSILRDHRPLPLQQIHRPQKTRTNIRVGRGVAGITIDSAALTRWRQFDEKSCGSCEWRRSRRRAAVRCDGVGDWPWRSSRSATDEGVEKVRRIEVMQQRVQVPPTRPRTSLGTWVWEGQYRESATCQGMPIDLRHSPRKPSIGMPVSFSMRGDTPFSRINGISAMTSDSPIRPTRNLVNDRPQA